MRWFHSRLASPFAIKIRQLGALKPGSHIQILTSGMFQSSAENAEATDHDIARLLNTRYSPTEYGQVLEYLFKDPVHCSEQQSHSRDMDLVRAALKARIKKTSILERHTALRLVITRRVKKRLDNLRKIQNITRDEIRKKLGEEIYSDLVDEEMLSEIIKRKVVASQNKNLWEERFWMTTSKMMEPDHLHHQELGELVKNMLITEVDDEGSCEQLLMMEQSNREMLLGWLGVARVNFCRELG